MQSLLKNIRKTIYLLFLASFLLSNSKSNAKDIYPAISKFVGSTDFLKYKKIAVLPFTDAPTAYQSGQIVQGLASQSFAKFGFDVAERAKLYEILKEQSMNLSGVIDPSQQINVGRLLGVNAIVVGEVGQYTTQERHTDTVYEYNPFLQRYEPKQGKQWMENHVSISLRVVDIETGQLIYSGSGQFNEGLTNPPQQVAEILLDGIVYHWQASPGVMGIAFDKNLIIKEIQKHSPAQKAGLRKGDKIVKINNKELANLSYLEQSVIFWGNPGDEFAVDALRKDKFLTFKVILDNREKYYKY